MPIISLFECNSAGKRNRPKPSVLLLAPQLGKLWLYRIGFVYVLLVRSTSIYLVLTHRAGLTESLSPSECRQDSALCAVPLRMCLNCIDQ